MHLSLILSMLFLFGKYFHSLDSLYSSFFPIKKFQQRILKTHFTLSFTEKKSEGGGRCLITWQIAFRVRKAEASESLITVKRFYLIPNFSGVWHFVVVHALKKRSWPTCHSLIYLRSMDFNKGEDLRQKNREELRGSGHRLLQSAGYVTIALRILCLWLVTARREKGGLQASVLVVKHALSFVSYIYRMDITLIISSIHIYFRSICISSLYRPKRKVIL